MAGSAYDRLVERLCRASRVGQAAGLLYWDQETMMPAAGVAQRSGQLAELARIHHEMIADSGLGELIATCESDAALTADSRSAAAANVREARRMHDRAVRVPASLVEEFARATSGARVAWAEARRARDFARFRDHLATVVHLSRRKAACLGWPEGGEPWDALADGFEPGCTAAKMAPLFDELRAGLQPLIGRIADKPQPRDVLGALRVPADKQARFVRHLAEMLGFDFQRGRLDESVHPFCSGLHAADVRMTTRFRDDFLMDGVSSTIHETGHGLYEQGLPEDLADQPAGRAISLGIHESQSRLWQNHVGRSLPFWRWCVPRMIEHLGDGLAGLDPEAAYIAANRVQPSLIRVDADEATYNLHILVRFEIERALMNEQIEAADVPAVWNERFERLVGIPVPDDASGCLQDIHWSKGSFGYFPTYTLGNLYAAQIYEAAKRGLPDLEAGFAEGRFAPLREWLGRNVHGWGRRIEAEPLCEQITGGPLAVQPFLDHLRTKLAPIYDLDG